MKSKKVPELLDWLESTVRIIDWPPMFNRSVVEDLAEIAEIELSGDTELLEQKIKKFRRGY